ALLRSVVLLGASDLLYALAVSGVYVILVVTGKRADSGPFFLATTIANLVCSVALYWLKLRQPSISARFRGPNSAHARQISGALLTLVLRIGGGFTLALATVLLVPQTRELIQSESGFGWYALFSGLVIIEIILAIVLLY